MANNKVTISKTKRNRIIFDIVLIVIGIILLIIFWL